MISRKRQIIFPLVVIIIGLVIFSYTLINSLYFDVNAQNDFQRVEISSSTLPERINTNSIPVRLVIPSLNIDARIVEVGINPNGNMGTPAKFSDVGWYKHGTLPGNMGSAVMAGHIDNGLSLAGVFKNLKTIKVGDRMTVTRVDGSSEDFIVIKIDTYGYRSAPAEEIFNQNDDSYVKLITCVGKWTAGDKTYDERLVVTARAID